jgi:23S rRNA (pseudouridine1915-N3)-methyltransferase
MKISISAVGRLRNSPEKELVDDYLSRFSKLSKPFGLSLKPVIEIDDKKGGGPMSEAKLLMKSFQRDSKIIALDERGVTFSSKEFAKYLSGWAAGGVGYCHLVIGGADGLDKSLLEKADLKISFGKMVWPHMLARVMIAEQLYRAATILAGSPYHRE